MSLQFILAELNYAKEEFEKFKKPDLMFNAYRHWHNFVDFIGKAFNKLENIKTTGSNKFISEVNSAINLRRKDPLLRYITELRNADQHTSQILAGLEAISNIPSGSFTVIENETGNAATENLYAHTYKLKTIVNKGVPYVPPTIHRGQKLKFVRDPYEVGQLTINFYEKLYDDLSKVF